MDFSFGGKLYPRVATTRVDLSQSVHCDLGGFHRSASTHLRFTNRRFEGTKFYSPLYRRLNLSAQEKKLTPKEPRALWKKYPGGAEKKRCIPNPETINLSSQEDIIDLEPPSKKTRMESKNIQNGSQFNDAKDVEIVKVVSGSKPLGAIHSFLSKTSLWFGLTKNSRRSTVLLEEQKEDKRKYSELLSRHVYCKINPRKRPGTSQSFFGISQSTFGLALESIKSQTPNSRNARNEPEVIDLAEEKKEANTVPARKLITKQSVLVDRQRSITPVTQATEAPNVEKTLLKKRPSEVFLPKQGPAFLKPDFLEQWKEMHSKSLKTLQEKTENEKKKSELCSIISMVAEKKKREETLKDLEKKWKDYLTLTECFPEEDDVEIIPPLPELTERMQKDIDAALGRGNPNEVLADAFNLKIQRRDLHTLQGLNWLNDEVINFYMNLLMDRGKQEKYPSVYAFNTFFYPKLVSGGHNVLKRWTKKVDIFSHDFVLAPVHLGVHWCMTVIDMNKKTVMYFDSMGGQNKQCLTAIRQYLCDEMMDKKKEKLDISQWEFVCMKDIPHQMNGSDCGMFSCMYAEYTCRRASISFTQQDMPYFRRKMIYEIIKMKLLC